MYGPYRTTTGHRTDHTSRATFWSARAGKRPLLLAAFALPLLSGAAWGEVETIALEGDQVARSEVTLREFGPPSAAVMGNSGSPVAAFRARLESREKGTSDGPSALITRVLGGDPQVAVESVASTPAGSGLQRPAVSASADLSWLTTLDGAAAVMRSDSAGRPSAIAVAGEAAPGGGSFESFAAPQFMADDSVVFWAQLGAGRGQAVLACSGGDGDCRSGSASWSVLAQVGDALPDRSGLELCSIRPDISVAGAAVAFAGTAAYDCAGDADRESEVVLRLRRSAALETIALTGESAGGGRRDARYRRFPRVVSISPARHVGFPAESRHWARIP